MPTESNNQLTLAEMKDQLNIMIRWGTKLQPNTFAGPNHQSHLRNQLSKFTNLGVKSVSVRDNHIF